MEEILQKSLPEEGTNTLEKETKTFSLISVCVCRDAFEIGNKSLNNFNYKVNSFWQSISPFSTYSKKIPHFQNLKIEDFTWGTPWQRKCLLVDIQKDIIEKTNTSSDFLIIDTSHTMQRLARLSTDKNAYLSVYQTFENNKDVFNTLLNENENFEIIEPFNLDTSFIEKCLDKFFNDIKRIFKINKIILCEIDCAEDFCTIENDKITIKDYPSVYRAKKINEFLKTMNVYFEKNLEGCHVIKMPKNVLGNKQHKWGLHPMHYCDEYYDFLIYSIDIICCQYEIEKEKMLLEKLRQHCSRVFEDKRKIINLNNLYDKEKENSNFAEMQLNDFKEKSNIEKQELKNKLTHTKTELLNKQKEFEEINKQNNLKLKELANANSELKESLLKLVKNNTDLENEVSKLKTSKEYKFGSFFTYIPNKLKKRTKTKS